MKPVPGTRFKTLRLSIGQDPPTGHAVCAERRGEVAGRPTGFFRGEAEMHTTEQNKQSAMAFYDLMFNQSRPAEAIKRYVGDVYIQHNFATIRRG
jgi:hypothetical protein